MVSMSSGHQHAEALLPEQSSLHSSQSSDEYSTCDSSIDVSPRLSPLSPNAVSDECASGLDPVTTYLQGFLDGLASLQHFNSSATEWPGFYVDSNPTVYPHLQLDASVPYGTFNLSSADSGEPGIGLVHLENSSPIDLQSIGREGSAILFSPEEVRQNGHLGMPDDSPLPMTPDSSMSPSVGCNEVVNQPASAKHSISS
jgi:hypothetical protein